MLKFTWITSRIEKYKPVSKSALEIKDTTVQEWSTTSNKTS